MQKCDCAIFDENTFCLVEFKTDSEGKSTETKEDIINHAQAQIITTYSTIKKFQIHLIRTFFPKIIFNKFRKVDFPVLFSLETSTSIGSFVIGFM